MLNIGKVDIKSLATKTKFLDELYIGALVLAGVVFILVTVILTAFLVFQSGIHKWSKYFIKAGGALGFLLTG